MVQTELNAQKVDLFVRPNQGQEASSFVFSFFSMSQLLRLYLYYR
jgi:hypothetical protein